MREPEMKPCPFCGTPDGAYGPGIFFEQNRHFIGCIKCGARGPAIKPGQEPTDAYIIGQWNRRTP